MKTGLTVKGMDVTKQSIYLKGSLLEQQQEKKQKLKDKRTDVQTETNTQADRQPQLIKKKHIMETDE